MRRRIAAYKPEADLEECLETSSGITHCSSASDASVQRHRVGVLADNLSTVKMPLLLSQRLAKVCLM